MSAYTWVAENAARVLERCAVAAQRSGRPEDAVTLVAVTKTHPLEHALAAVLAGIRHFGENRVQEAEAKWREADRTGLTLHMVGRLQRNKARRAVQLFDVIHSCDSLALAEKLGVEPDVVGKGATPVLVEVNVSGEELKAGFAPDELRARLAELGTLPGIELRGLMTVAPVVSGPEDARPYFVALRRLSEELRSSHPALGPELSMGMTDDYEVAIEEGATLVRVGRAIYGPRPGA